MPEFLVIGQGSMGKRRVRCLLANGVSPERIVVYDTRADRISESVAKHGVSPAGDLDGALPDVRAVFVSVPGGLHLQYCLAAARAGKHWFCEIPLAVNPEGLEELIGLTRKRLIGAAGCQLLFHPLARALRAWSEDAGTGRILGGSYSLGTYLPEWHPYEDYRQFYGSDQTMGGGNLDVVAQELTWLRWILNQPICAITCRMSKVGALELAAGTPDHQEMIVEFGNGVMLSMHFDLNDRTHKRWVRFCAESSTAEWPTLEPMVRTYDAAIGKWSEHRLPEGFDYETCYHQEVAHYFHCIEADEPWPVALETAREIVCVLAAMHVSSKERRTVELKEVA